MEILSAFLAFSAIMIVLSTMATTLVEGIHKLMRQRSKDFKRMLENYYHGSVAPLINEKVSEKSDDFVNEIINNPAFDPKNSATTSKRGFFSKLKNHLFDTAFETLSTPQFVEQLARSKVGEKIGAQINKEEDELIVRLASEFERYGDAAQNYFARRAQVLSILVAIILAFTLNVDSIRMFQALASDNDIANRVLAQIDVDEWERKYGEAVAAGETEKFETIVEQIRIDFRSDAEQISKWDLPIGHSFFPYCGGSANAGDLGGRDPKCAELSDRVSKEISAARSLLPKQASTANQNNKVSSSTKVNPELLHIKILLLSREFWAWMINTVLAGLLIGLGAPFWFNTYRSLSAYIPGVKRGAITETRFATQNQKINDQTILANTALFETAATQAESRVEETDTKVGREILAKTAKPLSFVIPQSGVVNRSQLSKLFSSALHPGAGSNE